MNTQNQTHSTLPTLDELFSTVPVIARRLTGENVRLLIDEMLADTSRDATREERSKREKLASNRQALTRQRAEERDRRREAAEQAVRMEERRQRRAASMRTRELAAIIEELKPRTSAAARTSSELYATAIATDLAAHIAHTTPKRRSRRPHMLGLLCAALVATLLVPAAVSGSAPRREAAQFQKASVPLAPPVSSDAITVTIVAAAEQGAAESTINNETDEPRQSARRSEHRHSRRQHRQNSPPETVEDAQPQTRPALAISLDDNDVFSRGSD